MEYVFEVGNEVEARFNEVGYRGAWFRCKIVDTRRSGEEWEYLLSYLDFTEENSTWTRACEPDPVPGLANEKKLRWMIRPPMPPTLDEIEYERWKDPVLVVVFDKDYRVGDMIDWWHDSCFWTGRILRTNATNKKVQLTLPNPPQGEGKRYWGHPKDLRPALEWSMESGWIAVKPDLTEDVHRRRSVSARCDQPRVQLMNKLSRASPTVGVSVAHSQDSVTDDISLQSQRCDQPAQGPSTKDSVVEEASREGRSCDGPTGEPNVAVEPVTWSMDVVESMAKRRCKKRRETTGHPAVTVVKNNLPRKRRRAVCKEDYVYNLPLPRKRKRTVCEEDKPVCGKKRFRRTWISSLRKQNRKSSEDPEKRSNLEQANELKACTKISSGPTTPQHKEVRDTGKIWEMDGHPQSGDTSMVSEEKSSEAHDKKVVLEGKESNVTYSSVLPREQDCQHQAGQMCTEGTNVLDLCKPVKAEESSIGTTLEGGKEGHIPVPGLVGSEGEQAQCADEKTDLTIASSEGLAEAGAAAISKFSCADFPEELYELEWLSVRVQSMRNLLKRKFGRKWRKQDYRWKVFTSNAAVMEDRSTGAESCEAVGVAADQETSKDLAPVQPVHAVQSSDQEHSADLDFVKLASEIEHEIAIMNSNKILQGHSEEEFIQEAELELLEPLPCNPSEAATQEHDNSGTGGQLKLQSQTEVDIVDFDMVADAFGDGCWELKAEFVGPVASATEQGRSQDSLQYPGIYMQPNGVCFANACTQGQPVRIGNYATPEEAVFAHETAAGHLPFPRAVTDASLGLATILDTSRRKNLVHKETIGLQPAVAQIGLVAANSSIDLTGVREPLSIAQQTHTSSEGSSHLRSNETAERQTSVGTVGEERLVSVANSKGEPQPVEAVLNFACSYTEKVADATKPVVLHTSPACDAVQDDVRATNATGLETPPSLDHIKIRTFLDSVKMTGFATMKETEAACQARRTLLQTIFGSIDDSAGSADGIASADMLVFFASSVSYIDSDTEGSKVILRSRSGQRASKYESIPIGLYKTLVEAEAACKAISHCRKELKKFSPQVVELPQVVQSSSILKPEAVPQTKVHTGPRVWRPCNSDATLPPPAINHGQSSIQAKAQPSRATTTQANMPSPGNANCGMENMPYLTTSTTGMETEAFNVVLTDALTSVQARASPQVQLCEQASTHVVPPSPAHPVNTQVSLPGSTSLVPGNVQFQPPAAIPGAAITTNNDTDCRTLPQPVHSLQDTGHIQPTFLPANIGNTYVCCKTAVWPIDQLLVRRLQCKLCNCVMHTACAIHSGQLRLTKFTRNGQELERVLYRCLCNYDSEVLFKLLAIIWHIATVIAKHQNRNRVRSAAGKWSGSVLSVRTMPELGYLMETLSRLELSLTGASRNLFKLRRMVSAMLNYTKVGPDAVDYQRFVDWIAYHSKLAAGAARA